MNAIEMNQVTHQFASKKVLYDIDLCVKKQEIMGLLGPSGAGKTTIVRILSGQLHQTSGKALLLGKDTRQLQRSDYGKIGIMIDTFGLYERLSVYDNLAFYADIYRISKEKIDVLLKKVDLYEAKRKAVMQLSKGMRSRLSLARALMNDPQILFLDEPTSGLDPATAKLIHELLLKERDKGTAIFLTTHNMAEAESICDTVVLLHQGRIVEAGHPKQICRKYDHLKKIRIKLKDGNDIELDNSSASADRVRDYLKEEQIESIHSSEPNLESVFIELTGRGLES